MCDCAAQSMFSRAQEFNQPVAAWDVGQVTNMKVRRRPRRGLGKHLTASAAKRRVRVCWRGAGHVLLREAFQPASSCMGCWSGRRHGGAPPPALGVRGARHGCSCARAAWSGLGRLSLRVRWHCAQEMFYHSHDFNQPVAAWDVGKVTTMRVRRCPC